MAWVLFYDGKCAFCSESVRLIRRLDQRQRIFFESLQGERARQLGLVHHAADDGTLVLLRKSDGRFFLRSDALIELARALGGGWRVFSLARFIPKSLRDRIYRWVAMNRYRILGKSACQFDPESRRF